MSNTAQRESCSGFDWLLVQFRHECGTRYLTDDTRTPYETFRRWAAKSRLACREFNVIFTPLVYEFIDLNAIPDLDELLSRHLGEPFVVGSICDLYQLGCLDLPRKHIQILPGSSTLRHRRHAADGAVVSIDWTVSEAPDSSVYSQTR